MKFTKLCVFLALGLMAAVSCKSQYELLLASGDLDAKYDAAMNYFNNKKYQKAAQLFESMAVLTSGTERDDTVQYYWGLSNYRFKDYYTAESNFASFVENFPGLPVPGHVPLGTGSAAHPLVYGGHQPVPQGVRTRRHPHPRLPEYAQGPPGPSGPEGL